MNRVVYKICPRPLWESAEAAGSFEGAPVDIADGFIHFSTAKQVVETAHRHFSGQDDLVLAAVRIDGLDAEQVRWECSRGGELFPHLYGPLPLAAVEWVRPLPLGSDGKHVFQDLG